MRIVENCGRRGHLTSGDEPKVFPPIRGQDQHSEPITLQAGEGAGPGSSHDYCFSNSDVTSLIQPLKLDARTFDVCLCELWSIAYKMLVFL